MCITIAQGALERLYGGCNVIHANSLEKFRADLAGVSQPHVLLYADAPEEGLLALLRRSDLPFAVVTADPIDVVRDLMAERGIDVCNAIRAASLHFSTLDEIALDQKAIVIRRSAFEYDVEEIVRQLMRVADRRPDLNQIDELLGGVFPAGNIEGVWSVEQIFSMHFPVIGTGSVGDALLPGEVSLVKDALGDFTQIGARAALDIKWGRALFLSADVADLVVPPRLSLTGPPRRLVHGPFAYLPRGQWNAEVKLKIWDNHGRIPFCLRVDLNEESRDAVVFLPIAGSVDCSFNFFCTTAQDLVVISVMVQSSAIEGDIEFCEASLARIS
jgi:hypothetical protein